MCKYKIPAVDSTATPDNKRKAFFDALYNADLSDVVKEKNSMKYIPWSQTWKIFKDFYPSATYQIHTNPTTGLPYFVDPKMGIMVHTSVSADGLTYENWLPVMDYQNRSQLSGEAYTVSVYDKSKRQSVEKHIEKAFVFDCNTAIQRSLCKCMGMFGLALKLWSKLDLESTEESVMTPPSQQQPMQVVSKDPYAGIKTAIGQASDITSLMSLYLDHQGEIEGNPQIKTILNQRKQELQKAA